MIRLLFFKFISRLHLSHVWVMCECSFDHVFESFPHDFITLRLSVERKIIENISRWCQWHFLAAGDMSRAKTRLNHKLVLIINSDFHPARTLRRETWYWKYFHNRFDNPSLSELHNFGGYLTDTTIHLRFHDRESWRWGARRRWWALGWERVIVLPHFAAARVVWV